MQLPKWLGNITPFSKILSWILLVLLLFLGFFLGIFFSQNLNLKNDFFFQKTDFNLPNTKNDLPKVKAFSVTTALSEKNSWVRYSDKYLKLSFKLPKEFIIYPFDMLMDLGRPVYLYSDNDLPSEKFYIKFYENQLGLELEEFAKTEKIKTKEEIELDEFSDFGKAPKIFLPKEPEKIYSNNEMQVFYFESIQTCEPSLCDQYVLWFPDKVIKISIPEYSKLYNQLPDKSVNTFGVELIREIIKTFKNI